MKDVIGYVVLCSVIVNYAWLIYRLVGSMDTHPRTAGAALVSAVLLSASLSFGLPYANKYVVHMWGNLPVEETWLTYLVTAVFCGLLAIQIVRCVRAGRDVVWDIRRAIHAEAKSKAEIRWRNEN